MQTRLVRYADSRGVCDTSAAEATILPKTAHGTLANLPQTGYKLKLPLVPSEEVMLAKAALRFVGRAYLAGATKIW